MLSYEAENKYFPFKKRFAVVVQNSTAYSSKIKKLGPILLFVVEEYRAKSSAGVNWCSSLDVDRAILIYTRT